MTTVRCYNIDCKFSVYKFDLGYSICVRSYLTIVGPGNECEDAESNDE